MTRTTGHENSFSAKVGERLTGTVREEPASKDPAAHKLSIATNDDAAFQADCAEEPEVIAGLLVACRVVSYDGPAIRVHAVRMAADVHAPSNVEAIANELCDKLETFTPEQWAQARGMAEAFVKLSEFFSSDSLVMSGWVTYHAGTVNAERIVGEKLFFIWLSDRDRIRVRIVTRQGAVVQFVVQYETEIDGRYRPVVRYDRAHGFAHRDLMAADGSVARKEPIDGTDSKVIDAARRDLIAHWDEYRRNFEDEVRRQ